MQPDQAREQERSEALPSVHAKQSTNFLEKDKVQEQEVYITDGGAGAGRGVQGIWGVRGHHPAEESPKLRQQPAEQGSRRLKLKELSLFVYISQARGDKI